MNEDTRQDTILTGGLQHTPTILCFKEDLKDLPDGAIEQMEKDLACKITVLSNWREFANSLATEVGRDCPALILLDTKVFKENLSTIPEILSTVTTLHRCMGCGEKLSIGVTVDTKHGVEFIRELQHSGVVGIVPCNSTVPYEITIEAMATLLSGKTYWPRELIAQITNSQHVRTSTAAGIYLTSRQAQVLSLVCHRGLSNKKIALSLKISESTVKIHVSAIMKAYGVRNRTQLALAASSSLQA